jgi:hypothetical protein
MNSALKQAWVRALRSGKYEQGRGALRSHSRYCAMGVLYDLVVPFTERWRTWGALIPEPVLQTHGISPACQKFIATLNDRGHTFEQIADLIDQDADLEVALGDAVRREVARIQTHSLLPLSLKVFSQPVYFEAVHLDAPF